MAARSLLLVCAVCVNVLAQPAGRGVISGSVVEATSGDAVRKAIVTVTWHGTPRSWATTRTDGSGRFVFEGLPAGKYDLRANKQGLGTAIYGANSVRELGDVITLADGEIHGDIKLRFLRSGTISGRVLGADGEPVASINLSLLRPIRALGERMMGQAQQASTNDRGEYKFTGIDAGEYYVRCMPNGPQMGPFMQFAGNPAPLVRDLAVPQYYGGAREAKDAASLILRGGEVLAGIDFNLIFEHPAIIKGRVTGVPQLDQPAETSPPGGVVFRRGRRIMGGDGQAITIDLAPADDNQMFWGMGGAVAQGPDYQFEMDNNVPGRYRIQANIQSAGKSYSASQVIDAREGVADVVLSLAPSVEVKGHLTVEGPVSHPAEGFTIMIGGSPGFRGGMYSSQVKKDGSFSVPQVPPGEWNLNVNPSQQGMFEKAIHLGDKDFLYKKIEIPPGLDTPLNIILSSNTAAVTGEIDAGGAEGKRAGILLAPVGKLHNLARFYYAALSDDNGKFKLNAVAPGKYKIFALEKIATTSYRNPESADLLDALGEEVEVSEGAKIELHPKLIPEEKAKEILKP